MLLIAKLQTQKKEREGKMKKSRIQKRITAVIMVSVLSIWFAVPNAAYAKTITVDGKTITGSLSGNSSRVTASTAYTGGSGSVEVSVTGYACGKDDPNQHTSVSAGDGPRSTPGSASAGVSAPNGYRFYEARSIHKYNITGASGQFDDKITF